jgi:glycosyltransferase involved in cell wall biosynthesis
LRKRGIAVTALTARHDSALAPREDIDGIPVIRLPLPRPARFRPAAFFLSAAGYLLRHRARYDVIHVLGAYMRVVPIVGVARALGKPVVVKMTSSGTDDPSASRRRRFGGLLVRALRCADAVVSVSVSLSESYRRSGLPEAKLVGIPNGVATDVFSPASEKEKEDLRRRLALPAEGELVVFVGPVRYRKGIDTLLAAWPEVARRRVSARLALVGPVVEDAPHGSPSVEALLSKAEKTEVVGKVQNVEDYLRASDVFVLPTRLEGSPNALLEAMSCALPCVAGRVPGTEEVIEDGRSGTLFEPGDAARLGEALAGLVDDATKRRDLGTRARETIVGRYSLDSVADAHADLYGRLAGTPSRARTPR